MAEAKAVAAKGLFADRSVDDRVGMLKARTNSVHDHAVSLLWANESNRFINYTPTLIEQIPTSYAAHAYNLFRDQMHAMVVVKFCAIWDGVGEDRMNVPTLIALLESPDVLEALIETRRQEALTRQVHDMSPEKRTSEDIAAREEMVKRIRAQQAKDDVARARRRIEEAITEAKNLMASTEFKGIMNLRHKVAHLLVMTRAEKAGPVTPAKYGDESKLVERTIEIVEKLNLGINNTSYDWTGSREMAEKSTTQLWGNCTFNIPKR